MKPTLLFSNQLDNDGDIWGRLELLEMGDWPEVRCRERYIATSGLPGYQHWDGQETRGAGPIPRMDKADISCYQVATRPVYLPQTPGVMGNFYPITPYMLGMGRGDFGVHFDAGVEGSAGCVVIRNEPAWDDFQQQMVTFEAHNIEYIPLVISYS